jgi:pre-mRNA-splicing factor ATP-dependent RNA helicase DHX16
MEAENRESLLPDLRKESRRKYLAKRKEEKLSELKDDIMDDEFLFDEDQVRMKVFGQIFQTRKFLWIVFQQINY